MRFLILFTFACFAYTFSFTASAATVRDLHDAHIYVDDQTEESRNDAIAGAFQQVLVKVSGSKDVLNNSMLLAEQAKAQSYVSSLRYERDANNKLMLSVTFMSAPLQALLERAQAPVWGASRPLTQLWIAESTGQERAVVSVENPLWYNELQAAMQTRGLPVIFPSWDLEDQIALPTASLWGLFYRDIEGAVARYSSDGYLAGRIIKIGENYTFSGYLSYGVASGQMVSGQMVSGQPASDLSTANETNSTRTREELEVTADTTEALASNIADAIAERLSDRYAVVAVQGGESDYMLRVSGVQSFVKYRNLLDYLVGHAAIRNVRLVKSENDTLTLALELSGSWAQVWDVLALDNKLTSTVTPGVYSWQP